MVVAAPFSCGH